MRLLFLALLWMLIPFVGVSADNPPFERAVKASLIFSRDTNSTCKNLNVIAVDVRLENIYTSDVTWVGDYKSDVSAEVFGPKGNRLRPAPVHARIMSVTGPYSLSIHSQRDLQVSTDPHGSLENEDDYKDMYA